MKRRSHIKSKDGFTVFANLIEGERFWARVNQQQVCYEKQATRGRLVADQEGLTNIMSDHPFGATEIVGLRKEVV